MICCIAVFSYRWFTFYIWVLLAVIMDVSMLHDGFLMLTVYNAHPTFYGLIAHRRVVQLLFL